MPSLSLCMIVKDEQEVICRCLSSVAPLVDEIIIVDTGSTDSTQEYCARYTDKIFHFTWQHDFAAARNFSFEQATGDYILWLDADDVIAPDQLAALQQLKTKLIKDVYFLLYDYSQDEYDNTLCTLHRERIVKNDGSFRWIYPVHEVISGTQGREVSHEQIVIRHARTASGVLQDQGRNLSILQQAITNPLYRHDPRIWFYLGREYHDHQQYINAAETFRQFLSFEHTWIEERVMATFRIAQCYAALAAPDNDHGYTSREYARKAIQLDDRWAEPYFVMGELAFKDGRYQEAATWFRECLREIPPVMSPVDREMYHIKPYLSLVFCYDHLGEYKIALDFNELALRHKPADAGLLHNRKYLQSRLIIPHAIAWYGKNIAEEFPVYRLRTMQIQRVLHNINLAADMIEEEAALYPYPVVVFYKSFTAEEYYTMQRLKAEGKRVVLDLTENLLAFANDYPFYLPLIQLADLVICCSHILANLVRVYNPVVIVIEDPIEPVTYRSVIQNRTRLKAAWIGMPGNVHHAEALRGLLAEEGCELVTIHNGPGHDKYWTLNSWQYHLAACDFAILPLDVGLQPAKSNNKLTTCMAAGLPVIASPLDAYLRLITPGENALLASTPEDWRSAIHRLCQVDYRHYLRNNGLHTAMAFRPENIALKWWKALQPESYNNNAVDIIIPTIYDTPHLYHCISSILACTQIPYNIIVVNSGSHTLHLPEEITVIPASHLNFAAAINLGVVNSSAPYICILNDDVIVSDGWLQPLLTDVQQGAGFSNPLSNCDFGSMHHYLLQIGTVKLGPATNMLLNGQIVEKDHPANAILPTDIWSYIPGVQARHFYLDWVPFFCTVTSRALFNTVGMLDETFNNGCEDVDYCRRATAMGYRSVVNERSFVFHFGGTSTEPYMLTDPLHKNESYKRFAWKYNKPLLCIHAGNAFESWNANTIKESGIGGSETAVAAMAAEFVREGYQVVVCCACEGKEAVIDGVEYISLHKFQHFIDRHYIDVFIISRYSYVLKYRVRAAKKYFWLHDMTAISTADDEKLLTAHVDSLDGVFCLSPWHRDFVTAYHQIPIEKIIVTGNGIQTERFKNIPVKTLNRFIYSSSPDRSLDKVLRLFPDIRKALPNATLHIYYGFDNWAKSLERLQHPAQLALKAEIDHLLTQEGVFYHGRVDQQTLANAFLESDIWLYPTKFTETYCITALEAQAAGALCVCTDLAGLSSTVSDRGIFIQLSPDHPAYDQHIIGLLVDIQAAPSRKYALLDKARHWALQQSWSTVAKQWCGLFQSTEVNNISIQVKSAQY